MTDAIKTDRTAVPPAAATARGRRLGAVPAYGSHLPALAEMILRTDGAILELGGGLYSTPLLHAMGPPSGRLAVTIETDPAWRAMLFARFAGVLHVVSGHMPAVGMPAHWSVVLIDGPVALRQPLLAALADSATFLVCHDTLGADVYGWDFGGFRYRRDFRDVLPGTTVVSNEVEP